MVDCSKKINRVNNLNKGASTMGKATQIYRNGTILTMDSRGSVVSALAVEGSVVLAVGTDDDVMAHAGPDTVVTDLRGRTMLPGFIDGHSHFVWAGSCSPRSLIFPPRR